MRSNFDSPNPWTATSTGYVANLANPDLASLALSTVVVGAPGKEQVWLFYTKGSDNQIQAAWYDVAAGNWNNFDGFDLVNIFGMPRAVLGWTDDSGATHIRIYFIQKTSEHDPIIGPNTYYCSLNEIKIDSDSDVNLDGPRVIRTYAQNDNHTVAGFSDAIAGVTWADNRQIRLYYYEGDYMIELASSNEDGKWAPSNSWEQGDVERQRFPITATAFTTATAGLQIRVYRHINVNPSGDVMHEWAWDQSQSKWTDQDLSKAVNDNTNGLCQPSVVSWVARDDNGVQNVVHIRLYQLWGDLAFAGGNTYISESSFDTGSGWTADTAILTPEYMNRTK